MVRQLCIKLVLSLFLVTAAFAQNPLPSPIPNVDLSKVSFILAGGSPTTPPRHGTFLGGASLALSSTQDMFVVVGFSPSPVNRTEQTQILLGLTQQLGPITLSGIPMKTWFSEAFGASLVSAGSLTYTSNPASLVASASTNKAFTAQYVFGISYALPNHPHITVGPVVKYTRVVNQPSIAEAGIYIKYSLGK